jgi:hypothetical protein
LQQSMALMSSPWDDLFKLAKPPICDSKNSVNKTMHPTLTHVALHAETALLRRYEPGHGYPW